MARTQFLTTKFGNPAKDQTVTYDEDGETFYSYGSPVARKTPEGAVLLHPSYWDYSATTGQYRNQFLGEGIAETRKRIEAGDYTLQSF